MHIQSTIISHTELELTMKSINEYLKCVLHIYYDLFISGGKHAYEAIVYTSNPCLSL